jgi:hypothetical protein
MSGECTPVNRGTACNTQNDEFHAYHDERLSLPLVYLKYFLACEVGCLSDLKPKDEERGY